MATASSIVLISAIATGCNSSLPKPAELPDLKAEQLKVSQKFSDEQGIAIERIRVPNSSMKAVSVGAPLPAHISRMPIDVKFPSDNESTLSSLVQTLSAVNVQVAFQWSNPSQGEDILQRKLPFLAFQGTIGEMMAALRTGLGIVTWYENGLIYISNQERYAITMPQNKDILESVRDEIKNLGADNIVISVRGGKIIYTASPTTQDQVIGPFLARMSKNLAVVNLQVAVVSLSLTDKTDSGFDWNKFQLALNTTPKGIDTLTRSEETSSGGSSNNGNNSGNNNGNNNNNTTTRGEAGDLVGTAMDLTSTGLSLSKTSLGNIFGTYGAVTVGGAINFLSNFGTTNITQNVSLKTLSGSVVKLQSGQEVPYVKGVSNTSNGNNNNSTGSTETATVETGLTIEMTPYYDSDAEVVTVDVDVQLDAILEFVELSAGNQIGTLTQPLVQKQNMNDIIRMQAGRTVVIGGLQYDSDEKKGNEPAFMRKHLQKAGKADKTLGSRSRNVSRNALFIILRPTLTVYETGR